MSFDDYVRNEAWYDDDERFGTGPEMIAEIRRLRSIIQRRLDCDGSNGVWNAKPHYDLTAEMREAVKGIRRGG